MIEGKFLPVSVASGKSIAATDFFSNCQQDHKFTSAIISFHGVVDLKENILCLFEEICEIKVHSLVKCLHFGPRVYPKGSSVIVLVGVCVRLSLNISETAH